MSQDICHSGVGKVQEGFILRENRLSALLLPCSLVFGEHYVAPIPVFTHQTSPFPKALLEGSSNAWIAAIDFAL